MRSMLWLGMGLGLLALPAWSDEGTDKRLDALETEIARMKGTPGGEKVEPKKDDGSPINLTYKKGINFNSEDGNFTMKWTGYAIEAGRFFTQTSPNDNTFYNQETLFGFSGTVNKLVNYKIDLVLGPTTGMNDSYAEYAHSDAFALKFGQFKEPFLYEETFGNLYRDFTEHTTTRRLAPARNIGVGVSGKLLEKRFAYEFGYFNGGNNSSLRNTTDNNDDKDWALRLSVTPFLKQKDNVLQNLTLAVAGTMAREDSATPNGGAASAFTTRDSTTQFLTFGAGVRIKEQTNRHAVSALWNRGPCKFMGEFASMRLDLEKTADNVITNPNTRFDAWYVQATYVLTGEDAQVNGLITPKNPVKKGEGGGWGAWEVAGRVSKFQAEREPFYNLDKQFASSPLPTSTGVGSTTEVTSWMVGLNWSPIANAKVLLDYGENTFGADYINTLGADSRGTEKFILLSSQVNF